MRWIAMTLQVVLGVLFPLSAVPKLTGGLEEMREHLLIAPWFWGVTALVELIGAAGMLAGLKYPRLAVLAGLWLAATMAGGILAHLRVGDPVTAAVPAAVLLVLALTGVALRWRAERGKERMATPSR